MNQEPKFVLLESCFTTQAKDWERLLTITVDPVPRVRNNLPALLCDRKTKRYNLHIVDSDHKPVTISVEVQEEIKRMYETSYLFGKSKFNVGFLKICQL